jgi:hypothetical protein
VPIQVFLLFLMPHILVALSTSYNRYLKA